MTYRAAATIYWNARRRGVELDPMQFATLESLTLSPLPCWKHLPLATQRRLVTELIADIDREAAVRREQTGSQVLGVPAILGQHPFDKPAKPPSRQAGKGASLLERHAAPTFAMLWTSVKQEEGQHAYSRRNPTSQDLQG